MGEKLQCWRQVKSGQIVIRGENPDNRWQVIRRAKNGRWADLRRVGGLSWHYRSYLPSIYRVG